MEWDSNNQNNEDNCQTELDVALWDRSKVENWSQDNTSRKTSHYTILVLVANTTFVFHFIVTASCLFYNLIPIIVNTTLDSTKGETETLS